MNNKTISIREAIKNKPSIALQMMVKGLVKQSKRKTFEINMGTFGELMVDYGEQKTCYGCAATCTIQQIANKNFTGREINSERGRARFLGFRTAELADFESVIDDARTGSLESLFDFCGKTACYKSDYDDEMPYLNDEFHDDLPTVRKIIRRLKKDGL